MSRDNCNVSRENRFRVLPHYLWVSNQAWAITIRYQFNTRLRTGGVYLFVSIQGLWFGKVCNLRENNSILRENIG